MVTHAPLRSCCLDATGLPGDAGLVPSEAGHVDSHPVPLCDLLDTKASPGGLEQQWAGQ